MNKIDENPKENLSLSKVDKSRFQKFISLLKKPFTKFFDGNIDLENFDKEEPVDEFLLRREAIENEGAVEVKEGKLEEEEVKEESIDQINEKRTLIHENLETLYKKFEKDASENKFLNLMKSAKEIFEKPEDKNYISHTHVDNFIIKIQQILEKNILKDNEKRILLNFLEIQLDEKILNLIPPITLMRIYFVLRNFNDDEKSQKIIKKLDSKSFEQKYLNTDRMSIMFYLFQFIDKNALSDEFFADVIKISQRNNIDNINLQSMGMLLYGLFDFKEVENAKILINSLFEYFEKNILKNSENMDISSLPMRIGIITMRQVYAIYNKPHPEELGRLFFECSAERNKKKNSEELIQNSGEIKMFKALKSKFKNAKDINFFWGNHKFGFECDILLEGDNYIINVEVDGEQHEEEKHKIHDKRRDVVLKREGMIILRFALGKDESLENFVKQVEETVNIEEEKLKKASELEKKIIWEAKKKERNDELSRKKTASIEARKNGNEILSAAE